MVISRYGHGTAPSKRTSVWGWISVLSGVCLIGAGIAGILRADFAPHTGYLAMLIAPGEILLGSLLFFIPLYVRLSRNSEEEGSREP